MATKRQHVKVGRRSVEISNLDKLMYPGHRFTKARVIDYYIRIAPYLLPHLKNRPVTMKRFPEGVFGEFFYEKDAPNFTPTWVKTFPVPRRGGSQTVGQTDIRYILINDLPTLVWVANLANLEIHPFLHRVPKIDQPTAVAFDCDPGEGADVLTCARVALMLRDLLRELKLESYVKVSGSKGLQLYVPLNSKITYDVTQPFAKAVAELLAEREPKLIVSEMPKAYRTKKVFIDWSQNDDYKTTVSVYSLRAKIYKPFVSLPVDWDELELALKKKDGERLYFDPDEALKRVEKVGDLWADVNTLVQKLPSAFTSYLKKTPAKSFAPTPALEPYARKRDFTKTSEPKPARQRSKQGSQRRFVVQKHAASHLHYDFRLEMHGVLKSWAVPKGPSVKEDEARLAMATEDHPIEYLDFEGVIPKGQYGGGTVMVWDIGTYNLIEGNYYKGFVRVYLNGSKLKGEWTVERIRDDKRNAWQLRKTGGNTRAISAKRDDQSALTGRTMKQIGEARDKTWQSNRSSGLR